MTRPDRNFLSIADVDGYELHDCRVDPSTENIDPRSFDDILKFSHARNVTASRLYVAGGRENAVDMNRECQHVRLQDSLLLGGGQCAVVIKGGCQDITLARVALAAPAPACDIELGGWSDQSFARTERVTLEEVSRRDGLPVRVVVGYAAPPLVQRCRVRVLFWRSLALKAYWAAKFFWVRIIRRQPPPGPHL